MSDDAGSSSVAGGAMHQNFLSTVQRSLEQSAEVGAVASVDPVTVIEVADQLEEEPTPALSSTTALSASQASARFPDSDSDAAAAMASTDKLSPPGRLTKERSAADALAANRLPIAITWQDVKVTVELPPPSFMERRRQKKTAATKSKLADTDRAPLADSLSSKVILDGVSGYCRPGQLLAIMGSSGAGTSNSDAASIFCA